MAQRKITTEKLRAIHALAASWGKLVARRAFGNDGPDLRIDLTALQQIAATAADGLNQGTLEILLQQQARCVEAQQPCPKCRRLCPVGTEDRPLAVQGGCLTYHEPVCHCPDCRRDF